MKILIPMAGAGSRFIVNGNKIPKPLIDIKGKKMIIRAIETLDLEGDYIFIIRKYDNADHNKELNDCLQKIKPNSKIIEIDRVTEGATATCLIAKELIDNEEALLTTNCDQLMGWNSNEFLNKINEEYDGLVVTYPSDSPNNSFIELGENGLAIRIEEKNRISNLGLTGIHYWREGRRFVEAAEHMINNKEKHKNEYYIAPTYNYLIQRNFKISNFHIKKSQYIQVGTPEELDKYLNENP